MFDREFEQWKEDSLLLSPAHAQHQTLVYTFCPLFTTSLKTSRSNDMGTIISCGGVLVQCQESEVWRQWNREILAETFREEDGLSRRHQRESRGKKVGDVCGRVSLTQPYTSVSNSHRRERERESPGYERRMWQVCNCYTRGPNTYIKNLEQSVGDIQSSESEQEHSSLINLLYSLFSIFKRNVWLVKCRERRQKTNEQDGLKLS